MDDSSDYDPLFDDEDPLFDGEDHGGQPDPSDVASGEVNAPFKTSLALPQHPGVPPAQQQRAFMRSVENVGTIALPVSPSQFSEHNYSHNALPSSSGPHSRSSPQGNYRKRPRSPDNNTLMPASKISRYGPPSAQQPANNEQSITNVEPPPQRRKLVYRSLSPVDTSSFEGQILGLLRTDLDLLSSIQSYVLLLANTTSASQSEPSFRAKYARRKRVPANAEEWDVPFPFAVGEGPEGYLDTWVAGRKEAISKVMASAVCRAVAKAEHTRAQGSEMDALVGWDEGPVHDRSRAGAAATAIYQWLSRTQKDQALQLDIDLDELSPSPPTESSVQHTTSNEPLISEEQLRNLVNQSVEHVRTRTKARIEPKEMCNTEPPSNLPRNRPLVDVPPYPPHNDSLAMAFDPLPLSPIASPQLFLPTPSASLSPSLHPSELSDIVTPNVPDSMIDPSLLPAQLSENGQSVTPPPLDETTALAWLFATFGQPTPAPSVSSLPATEVPLSQPLPSSPKKVIVPPTTSQRRRKNTRATLTTDDGVGLSRSTPRPGAKPVREVREKAQAARDKLQHEFDAVERQLWACSIEEGVLLNLIKILSKDEDKDQ